MNNATFVNTSVFHEAGPVIQIHIVAAVFAFVLGATVLWRKKGGRIHKLLGYTWVILMAIVAFGSFFIHELRVWGDFSPIHLLSVLTLVSLVLAIIYARKGLIRAHRQTMQSLYLGALGVAGGLAFMPGRVMNKIFIEPYFSSTASLSGDGIWQVTLGVTALSAFGYYLFERVKRRN